MESINRGKLHTPYISPLEPHKIHAHKSPEGKLNQVGNSEEVLRVIPFSYLKESNYTAGCKNLDEFKRRFLDEVNKLARYGIELPLSRSRISGEVDIRIGSPVNEDSPSLYIHVDNIKSAKFRALFRHKRKIEGLHRLLQGVIQYYKDNAHSPCLIDLGRRQQYVYGFRPGERELKWYLVDADPFFDIVPSAWGDRVARTPLIKTIQYYQEKYGKIVDFSDLLVEATQIPSP